MPDRGSRIRVALPEPVGDRHLAVSSYGLRERMPSGLLSRPDGYPGWLIMGFADPAWVEVDEVMRPVQPPGVMLWAPHQGHHYGAERRAWTHSWINLSGSMLAGWLAEAGLPAGGLLAGAALRPLERCILELHEELRHGPVADPAIMRNAVHSFVRRLSRAAIGAGSRPAPAAPLAAVYHHLARHYADPIDLPALARLAGWSVPHLCARFRAEYGVSPIAHLIRLRLAQAHLLLRDRGVAVADAAREVGYTDYRHFSRLFRRRYQVTPGEVRNSASA